MKRDRKHDRAAAVRFLQDTFRSANNYADRLDPKRRRNYERDPVLRALDAITAQCSRALAAVGESSLPKEAPDAGQD